MHVEALKDGTTVIIRELTERDLKLSCAFFDALGVEGRRYLRFDVSRPEIVAELLRQAARGRAYRIAAFVGNEEEIVAHGALELSADDWHRHIGELRVIVAPAHRGKRLGALLIRHLFAEAERRGVEKLVVRTAGPQASIRKMCERLGFSVTAVLPDHIKDHDGKLQPLVVMSCPLDAVSRALREIYRDDDWPDG